MGLMSYLRSRAGLVIFVIGLAIVAFLLGDIINYGTPFWMKSQNEVGSVNGESVDYQRFNAEVEQTVAMYQQQMGGGDASQMRSYAVQQVWSQFISREILRQEIEKIGLRVGRDELNDITVGSSPSMQIVQQFTNPETGQFDRNYLSMVINEAKTNPELRTQWEQLLENIKLERLNEKYSTLLSNSVYTTALEAEYDHNARNKQANFKYVMLDYTSVNDSEINLSDSDYKDYYEKNKNSFRNTEAVRGLEYVVFDATPTSSDTAMILSEINQLKADLQNASNEEQFVSSFSETKYPVRYYTKNQLSPALDSVVFTASAGSIVGPYLSDGVYEIAKVMESKNSPDSITASHILLNPTAEGGLDKAKAKADSIRGLLQSGESMSALAVEYSVDEASKVNGGELGTFARGRMLPAFEDAVFNARAGEVLVVETERGVHVVRVDNTVGNSRIAKLAVVDKSIAAGRGTTDAAYAKANTFFSAADKNNFTDVANSQGLTVQRSPRTLAMDNSLNGKDVPRDLIRWAFEAKRGDITDKVYESENHFFVARLTSVEQKGLQPLESIKSEIEPAVKNAVKARMLKEKLNNALSGSSSLEQAAQKISKNVLSVENVVLANPVIPGVALEGAVVGAVFGLQPNTPSRAIEGRQGVYAVEVTNFSNPKALTGEELIAKQKEISTSRLQRAWGAIFQALQDKADIDDNRIRFY